MLEPGNVVERYELVRLLGEGGMAKVWLVRHTTLGTEHALKVLQMTGPQLRLRFLEEGRAQSGLRHENIVRVSDVLEVDGLPAMVLDYIDGPDLQHWIVEHRPGPALAEQVFRGILAGVATAHAAQVVHRDLKPANVMMAKGPGGTWVPKVADFGLAKVLASADDRGFSTRQGHPMGTPRYMAPEQIRDASTADHRADLFALGAILFELLAHEPAFDGADLIEIFDAVAKGRRHPLPPDTPPHLAALVDQLLQVDPARRPPDVPTIVALLEAEATPPPRPASAPTALWLGAWSLVVGAGAVAAGGLLLVSFLQLRSDPEAPCAVDARTLGVVRAPTVFSRGAGDVWLLHEDLQVYADVPTADGEQVPVCRLGRGVRLTLQEDPRAVGSGRWVRVDGDAIAAPLADDPELGENRGPCEGEPGVVLGYVRTRGTPLGIGAPRNGGTFSVPAGREVYAALPTGDESPAVVCVLAEGLRFPIIAPPAKVGREWWVPFSLPQPHRP